MHKRQTRKKPLVLIRETMTYGVSWVFKREDVPIFDPSRGFPLSEPPLPLEVSDLEAEALTALQGVDPLVRGSTERNLDAMRRVLDDPHWRPSGTPESGFPWMVRKDLTPAMGVLQTSGDRPFLNNLAALTRWGYTGGRADKRLLKEVEALHAQAGPVLERQNTLPAWYALAWVVQAHFDMRGALHLIGLKTLQDARDERHRDYRDALKSRDPFLILTYRLLYRAVRGASDATELERAVAEALRGTPALNVRLVSDGLRLSCSLFDWVQLELADFWTSERPRECPGCGRWFWPTQVDTRHCHSRCRLLKREKTA